MARTTIYFVQVPGVKNQTKEVAVDSRQVSLEAYGAVVREHPLPNGTAGTKIIPWHRIGEVVQAPDSP